MLASITDKTLLTLDFWLKKTWFGSRDVNALRGRTAPPFVVDSVHTC